MPHLPRSPRNIPARAPRSRRARATNAATTSAAESAQLNARFASALARFPFAPECSAIAVSGGGDSVALMLLFADWAKGANSVKPSVLIVDHGLRSGAAKEAALTAQWAKAAGFRAHVLRWKGAKPHANIEEKARAARYALMGAWCKAEGLNALFVAHTRDDQAETFLLRLGRGSGVDGLSAMRARGALPVKGFEGVNLLRPLLGFSRAELRALLKSRGASWLEDPMNADPRFSRARVRAVLPALEAAGVSASRIAEAAAHLARAREALDAQTAEFLSTYGRLKADGSALLDGAALKRTQREIGLRALSSVLMRVSGEPYRPRFERLERLFDALTAGTSAKARTLHACRVGPAPRAQAVFGPATLLVAREGPRSAAASAKTVAAKEFSGSKSPQKGRNIPVPCNS